MASEPQAQERRACEERGGRGGERAQNELCDYQSFMNPVTGMMDRVPS